MQRHHWLSLLIVLVTIATFSEVRYADFVLWDDNYNVSENPYLNPVTAAGVLQFWREPYFCTYLPVTYSAWALIAHFAALTPARAGPPALDPHVFHLANLTVHLLNVLLVLAILRLLIRNDWAACAGALLFALHPVQVEPVAWVSGMKDLLGGLLSLGALWQYLRYAVAAQDGSSSGRRRLHYALASACFILALLAKPTAAAVPFIAWVLDVWMVGRPARRSALALVGWAALALPPVLLLRSADPLVAELSATTPLWVRPLVALDALAFYLYKLAVPRQLCCDYGRTLAAGLKQHWLYWTWVVPVVLGVLVWLGRRRWRWLVAAAGVLVAGLLPVLGLIPIPFQEYSTVADRYLYLAMLGPALALASFIARNHRSKLAALICALALGLLGFQSALQTLHWQNTFTLFEHTLELNPNSWVSHNNLGAAWGQRGRSGRAIAHFLESVRLHPEAPGAYVNLGHMLIGLGRTEQAVPYLREALRLRPDLPAVHEQLAAALDALGETEQAQAHWAEAIRLDPNNAVAHHNLAVSLYHQGRKEEAVAHWREALRIAPDYAQARGALEEALRP